MDKRNKLIDKAARKYAEETYDRVESDLPHIPSRHNKNITLVPYSIPVEKVEEIVLNAFYAGADYARAHCSWIDTYEASPFDYAGLIATRCSDGHHISKPLIILTDDLYMNFARAYRIDDRCYRFELLPQRPEHPERMFYPKAWLPMPIPTYKNESL